MKYCIHCNLSYEDSYENCPRCGKNLIAEQLKEYLLSPLDISADGFQKLKVYVDNVINALNHFQELTTMFVDKAKEERKNPNLIKNQKWFLSTTAIILSMQMVWFAERDNTNYSLRIIKDAPSGCAMLEFTLAQIAVATEAFATNYLKWMQDQGLDAVKVAQDKIGELSNLVPQAWEELDKIFTKLKQLS